MNAWLAAGKSGDYLLRGRLELIAVWSQTITMGLRTPGHEFLDASLAARTEEQQVRRVDSGARPTPNAERGGAPDSC